MMGHDETRRYKKHDFLRKKRTSPTGRNPRQPATGSAVPFEDVDASVLVHQRYISPRTSPTPGHNPRLVGKGSEGVVD